MFAAYITLSRVTFVATKKLLEIPAAATGSVILLGMCYRYYYYYNAYWFDDGEGGRLVHSAASIMPVSLLRPLEKIDHFERQKTR